MSATVTPIGVKVCTTVDLSSEHKVSPFGDDILGVTKYETKEGRVGRF